MPLRRMGPWSYSSTILNLALDGGELSALRFSRFTSGEPALGIHCIGGWVGPRAGLSIMEKRKISCTCQKSNPRFLGRTAHSLVTAPTEISRLSTYTKLVTVNWMALCVTVDVYNFSA
jgi:hypothetical protein